jgi:hypothetical protein
LGWGPGQRLYDGLLSGNTTAFGNRCEHVDITDGIQSKDGSDLLTWGNRINRFAENRLGTISSSILDSLLEVSNRKNLRNVFEIACPNGFAWLICKRVDDQAGGLSITQDARKDDCQVWRGGQVRGDESAFELECVSRRGTSPKTSDTNASDDGLWVEVELRDFGSDQRDASCGEDNKKVDEIHVVYLGVNIGDRGSNMS